MYVDYINNLIQTIKNMSKNDYVYFEKTAYEYHIKYLKNGRLRRADFNVQLERFLSNKTMKISLHNINSYLYAIDQMYDNGITDALLFARKGKRAVTWRQLFLRATTDVALPKNLKAENLDEENLKTLKSIFQKLLSACAHNDRDETGKRLRKVDEFFNITFNRD